MITTIGDVHGCRKTLEALLQEIPSNDTIVLTGDVIDRGKDSKGVLELIKKEKYLVVRGNHEDMMLQNYGFRSMYMNYEPGLWRYHNGGNDTIKSFHGKPPRSLVRWVAGWPLYLKFDDILDKNGRKLFVSHAGYSGFYSSLDQALNDPEFLWNILPQGQLKGYFTVYGHIIRENPLITDYSAGIDTGCHKVLGGKLTAYQFPSGKIWQQPNIE